MSEEDREREESRIAANATRLDRGKLEALYVHLMMESIANDDVRKHLAEFDSSNSYWTDCLGEVAFKAANEIRRLRGQEALPLPEDYL